MGTVYTTNALELIGAITDNCNPDPEDENKRYYRCSICIPNQLNRNGESSELVPSNPHNHKLIRNPNTTPSTSSKKIKQIPPVIKIDEPYNWNESESSSLDRIIGNIEPGHFASNNGSNNSSCNNSCNNSTDNSPIGNISSLSTVDINSSINNDDNSSDSKEDDYKLQIQQNIIQNNVIYNCSRGYIEQINGTDSSSNSDNDGLSDYHNKQRKNFSLTDIDGLSFCHEEEQSDGELLLNLGVQLNDRSSLTHNIYLKKQRKKNKMKKNRRVNSMF